MDNINELFEENSKLPFFIKYVLYFIKKILCILTIRKDKVCILPYRKIQNKKLIQIIVKMIAKTSKRVVLSNNLMREEEVIKALQENKIYICDGTILFNCLLYEIVNYISKMKNEDPCLQELFILSSKPMLIEEESILFLAKHFKRINIVTNHIKQFRKIENYLEEQLGMAITVTNNKRKSLIRATMVINFDFDEEMINGYNINPNAIIINPNAKVTIHSKRFNGINIEDYQITGQMDFEWDQYKKFDKKLLYESTIIGEKYNMALQKIKEDNIKIVNLIGKNGIIDRREYKRK